jgi:uncharacterized protein YjbJ (UPF0337 family)
MFESFGKMAGKAMDAAGEMANDAMEQAEGLADSITGRDSLERNDTYEAAKSKVEQLRKVPDDFLQVMKTYDEENGTHYYENLQNLIEAGDEAQTEQVLGSALDVFQEEKVKKTFSEAFGKEVQVKVEGSRTTVTVPFSTNQAELPDLQIVRDVNSDGSWQIGSPDLRGDYPSFKNIADAAAVSAQIHIMINGIYDADQLVEENPFRSPTRTNLYAKHADGKEYQVGALSANLPYNAAPKILNLMNDLYSFFRGRRLVPEPPVQQEQEDTAMNEVRDILNEDWINFSEEGPEIKVDSQETFLQSVLANPNRYMTDETGVDGNRYIDISLPRDGKSPEVIFSRIQHFIGEEARAGVGVHNLENYVLTDTRHTKDYEWNGETWVDKNGARCLVYGGNTTFILKKKKNTADLIA